MTDDPDAIGRDWIRTRPASIQSTMRRLPPGCAVTAKPGVELMIPAPGIRGIVVSYFESGTVGVVAPLTHPIQTPDGEQLPAGVAMRGECDPDQLDPVEYTTIDGIHLTPDWIADVLDC